MNQSLEAGPAYGFGLYIHWPYCARICPYCDFNVYTARQRDTAPLLQAMQADLQTQAADLPDHPPLDSIYFGGGTPSLMSPGQMASLIETAAQTFGLAELCEISLEVNPNDIADSDMQGWLKAGLNRLSLGVQSLDDRVLHFLGRDHDAATAQRALATIQKHFENYSIDLIYALPDQTEQAWLEQLVQALNIQPPHISLYELTIKADTVFGKRARRGELIPMPDDMQADLYERTNENCERAGLPAYEISNHARQSRFQSRHNQIYWASGDWVGIGPGAHGRITQAGQRQATLSPLRPEAYIQASGPVCNQLSPSDIALEFLAMGLRPVSGLDLDRFEKLFGHKPDQAILRKLQEAGLINLTEQLLTLTPSGRLLADSIARALV